MEHFTPYSAFTGGILIGISAVILLLFNGRIAGISGILNGVFYARDKYWRVVFLLGLVLGSMIFAVIFPEFNQPRTNYPLPLLIIGGFLVGFGARFANGCVSGHGICGLANLSLRSLTAISLFMFFGMITVYFLRHILNL